MSCLKTSVLISWKCFTGTSYWGIFSFQAEKCSVIKASEGWTHGLFSICVKACNPVWSQKVPWTRIKMSCWIRVEMTNLLVYQIFCKSCMYLKAELLFFWLYHSSSIRLFSAIFVFWFSAIIYQILPYLFTSWVCNLWHFCHKVKLMTQVSYAF